MVCGCLHIFLCNKRPEPMPPVPGVICSTLRKCTRLRLEFCAEVSASPASLLLHNFSGHSNVLTCFLAYLQLHLGEQANKCGKLTARHKGNGIERKWRDSRCNNQRTTFRNQGNLNYAAIQPRKRPGDCTWADLGAAHKNPEC
ncbi:uncharacterized protein LOC120655668 [Panicum virgatum]|uniref:uncharacterized protein LOC120655668 n=1 Tax=Panicum virgatum TaxID=38727 RepID=UPI0019D61EFD|nr:uncharacterized protein LOC120655668 [Panicum virgatum]